MAARKLRFRILDEFVMDEEFERILKKYKGEEIPTDVMDLKIQGDRVIYVMNRMMTKLHLLAYMPYFLKDNGAVLRKYLKKDDLFFVLQVCNQYGEELKHETYAQHHSESALVALESITAIADREEIKISGSNILGGTSQCNLYNVKIDPVINQVVDTLFYSKCLKWEVKSLKQKQRYNKYVIDIIKLFMNFKDTITEKLYITGDEENKIEMKLRRMFKKNIILKETIADLTSQLERQRRELGEQLSKKAAILDDYHRKITITEETNQITIQKCLHDSEKLMMHKSLESEVIQAEVAEEAEKLRKEYEQLLDNHLEQEKDLRKKRFKLAAQLQNWLNTYDQEIGEKNAEYEVLKQEYDEKMARKKELETKMEEQEDEYQKLMEEKREEEERLRIEKLHTAIKSRAARIIQRTWRAYKERKLARKKGKKGKKGKGKK